MWNFQLPRERVYFDLYVFSIIGAEMRLQVYCESILETDLCLVSFPCSPTRPQHQAIGAGDE